MNQEKDRELAGEAPCGVHAAAPVGLIAEPQRALLLQPLVPVPALGMRNLAHLLDGATSQSSHSAVSILE